MASLPASINIIITLSFLVLLLTASRCEGRAFVVASGADGFWRTYSDPEEPHHQFKVNDTLAFFHDFVEKAVLWVSKDHYATCDTTQPILRFAGEGFRFVLNSTGYYYFISADAELCNDGHRLVVQVIQEIDVNTTSPVQPPPPKLAPLSSPSSRNASSSPVAPPTAPVAPSSSPSAGNTSSSSSSSSSSSVPPSSTAPNKSPPVAPSPPSPFGQGNTSICSPALSPIPGPNVTYTPPPSSSAMAVRSGVLSWLVVGAAIILA